MSTSLPSRDGADVARTAATKLRFASYELDLTVGELRREGQRVRLAEQPLRLLALLAGRPGELVTRNEIRNALWPPGTHLEFDQSINTMVREVRLALHDDVAKPRFVATVPRRGYRFVAASEDVSAGDRPRGGDAVGRAPPRRRAALLVTGLAALVLFVGVLVATIAGRDRPSAATLHGELSALAVLPFQSLAVEEDEPDVALGVTEDLIAFLGRRLRGQVAVIAPTSALAYRDFAGDASAFAREVGADYLLTGTVRHRGSSLRISTRLVRAADGGVLWATSYDRHAGDLLEVEEDVAEKIAEALALHLLPSEGGGRLPPPEAHEAYLHGRSLMSSAMIEPDAARRALHWFERSTQLDPGHAQAWAGLAHATLRSGQPPGAAIASRELVERALALDETLVEALLLAAHVAFYLDLDFAATRRWLERALESNPSSARAHHSLAAWYSARGLHEPALAELEAARTLDPLAANVISDVCWLNLFAGRWSQALAGAEATLARFPGYRWALECRLLAHQAKGDEAAALAAAVDHAERARRTLLPLLGEGSEGARVEAAAWRDFAAARSAGDPASGLAAYWRWQRAVLEALLVVRPEMVTWEKLAVAPAQLGDLDAALDYLERARVERRGWRLPFLAVDPELAPLRGEPRFERLLDDVLGEAPEEVRDGGRSGRRPAALTSPAG